MAVLLAVNWLIVQMLPAMAMDLKHAFYFYNTCHFFEKNF